MAVPTAAFGGDSWTVDHHRWALHAGEAGAVFGIGLLVAGITLAAFLGGDAALWAIGLILTGPLVIFLSVIVTASYLERLEPARYVHEN